MNNPFINIITHPAFGIITALMGFLIGNHFALGRDRRKEFNQAASTFRSKILAELLGFYPIDQYWEEKDFPRIYRSIPRIKSAAAEFKFFVKRKDGFDTSIKDYDEYCRKTTYQDVTAYAMYKDSMYKPDDKGPREKFKNIVEHILSFAKEK